MNEIVKDTGPSGQVGLRIGVATLRIALTLAERQAGNIVGSSEVLRAQNVLAWQKGTTEKDADGWNGSLNKEMRIIKRPGRRNSYLTLGMMEL